MSELLIVNLLIIFIIIFCVIYFFKKKTFFFLKILNYLFKITDYYFSYKLTDKFLSKKIKEDSPYLYSKFAIIIQGPIILNDNFTEKTIIYYSKKYPKSPIIFSSWKKDIKKINKIFFKKNVYFIANEYPNYHGSLNINLQSISTNNAILLAKKLKCNYVLKTRSDCRIGADNFLSYFSYLVDFYKLKNNLKTKQKKRIITTNFTLKHRLYGISDILMFGHIDDLYKYFNVTTSPILEKKHILLKQKQKFKDSLFFLDKKFCTETYFFYEFFKKIDIKLRWSVKDYLKKISENFIILDNQTINLYWIKCSKVDRFFDDGTLASNSEEFNFNEWLKFFYKFNSINSL